MHLGAVWSPHVHCQEGACPSVPARADCRGIFQQEANVRWEDQRALALARSNPSSGSVSSLGQCSAPNSARAPTAKQGGEDQQEAGLWIPVWQHRRLHKGGRRWCCLINHDEEQA